MAILAPTKNDLAVVVNGAYVEGLLQASISTSNLFSSDTFCLTIAANASPYDLAYWSALVRPFVEISAVSAELPTGLPLITGYADGIYVDILRSTVTIEGRDLTSLLIDTFSQRDYVNQTASEIVSTIAEGHGLGSVVLPTLGSAGRYYADNYTRLSLGQFSKCRSDWDIVVQLARENNFDVFVVADTLYFQPTSTGALLVTTLQPGDVWGLKLERAYGASESIGVTMLSWNTQNKAVYSESAGGIQSNYLFSAANLTFQQVSDAALRYSNEISRLNIVLEVDMPWDLTMAPRSTLLLESTGSSFDGVYRIESVDRHFNTASGSRQHVRASLASV